ncbi:MAG: hypothetical protein LBJ01_10960 [Tannerella sp.]|jgi:hypothetical protein|nr:hypothetical protein [Tannerella sp.]
MVEILNLKSLANLRKFSSHEKALSTIHRLGWDVNPSDFLNAGLILPVEFESPFTYKPLAKVE